MCPAAPSRPATQPSNQAHPVRDRGVRPVTLQKVLPRLMTDRLLRERNHDRRGVTLALQRPVGACRSAVTGCVGPRVCARQEWCGGEGGGEEVQGGRTALGRQRDGAAPEPGSPESQRAARAPRPPVGARRQHGHRSRCRGRRHRHRGRPRPLLRAPLGAPSMSIGPAPSRLPPTASCPLMRSVTRVGCASRVTSRPVTSGDTGTRRVTSSVDWRQVAEVPGACAGVAGGCAGTDVSAGCQHALSRHRRRRRGMPAARQADCWLERSCATGRVRCACEATSGAASRMQQAAPRAWHLDASHRDCCCAAGSQITHTTLWLAPRLTVLSSASGRTTVRPAGGRAPDRGAEARYALIV